MRHPHINQNESTLTGVSSNCSKSWRMLSSLRLLRHVNTIIAIKFCKPLPVSKFATFSMAADVRARLPCVQQVSYLDIYTYSCPPPSSTGRRESVVIKTERHASFFAGKEPKQRAYPPTTCRSYHRLCTSLA